MLTIRTMLTRRVSTSRTFLVVMALVILVSAVGSAWAALVSLEDRNSSAMFELLSGVAPGSFEYGSGGLLSWDVDGVGHAAGQWFWVRMNDEAELSLDALILDWYRASDGDRDEGDERLVVDYLDPDGRFLLTLDYTLCGGSDDSGASDIGLLISLANLTDAPLSISLIEYTDWDISGTSVGDTVEVVNANTVRQWDGGGAAETVATAAPDAWELSSWPETYWELMDSHPTDLNGSTTQLTGDVTWAGQWSVEIPAAGTYQISQDTRIWLIPEPATLGLVAVGGVIFLYRRRYA